MTWKTIITKLRELDTGRGNKMNENKSSSSDQILSIYHVIICHLINFNEMGITIPILEIRILSLAVIKQYAPNHTVTNSQICTLFLYSMACPKQIVTWWVPWEAAVAITTVKLVIFLSKSWWLVGTLTEREWYLGAESSGNNIFYYIH